MTFDASDTCNQHMLAAETQCCVLNAVLHPVNFATIAITAVSLRGTAAEGILFCIEAATADAVKQPYFHYAL